MSRDEILKKVTEVLVECLGVDADEVLPSATLREDLGAESIDFLDIVFRLEKAFGIKIPRGELFPENLMNDPAMVQDGRLTDSGLKELKSRMPHSDFSTFEQDPRVENMPKLFTVDALVNYVQSKLSAA